MKKIIIIVAIIMLCASISFLGIQLYQYYKISSSPKIEDGMRLDLDLDESDKKIHELEEKRDQVKIEKEWKIEVLETWKKEVNGLDS